MLLGTGKIRFKNHAILKTMGIKLTMDVRVKKPKLPKKKLLKRTTRNKGRR